MNEQLVAIIDAGYSVTIRHWPGDVDGFIADADSETPDYDGESGDGDTVEDAVAALHANLFGGNP